MDIKIVRFAAGDWEMIFKDNRVVYSGHGADSRELLRSLGIKHEVYYTDPEQDVNEGTKEFSALENKLLQ